MPFFNLNISFLCETRFLKGTIFIYIYKNITAGQRGIYCKLQVEICTYITENKQGSPKCNIINKIISFNESL